MSVQVGGSLPLPFKRPIRREGEAPADPNRRLVVPGRSDWIDSELACARWLIRGVTERSTASTDCASIITAELVVDWNAASLADAPVVFGLERGGWWNNQSGGTLPTPVVVIAMPRVVVLLLTVPLVYTLSRNAGLAVGVNWTW